MNEFPHLFLIARNPDSTVAENREGNAWNLQLRRNLQDWEIESFIELLSRLGNFSLNPQVRDSIAWNNSIDKVYSVKSGYTHFITRNLIIESWPWKLIWKTKLPPKVICFSWTALHEACLTQDNLRRRKIQMANRCYMCHSSLESVNHLLLHCTVASEIWNMFFLLFGLSWVMPRSTKEACSSWSQLKVEKTIKNIWLMVPGVIFLVHLD